MDPIVFFQNQREFEDWLRENHDTAGPVFLAIAKKGAGVESITYAEALEAALCFGWIDGLKKTHDAQYFLQRFSRRTKTSVWSQVNRAKALELMEQKRMHAAGHAAIEVARANGRWETAYESPGKATVPDDLAALLKRKKKAAKFFETLSKQNRYAILFRLQTAKKPETRAARLEKFVGMLERGETIYPQ